MAMQMVLLLLLLLITCRLDNDHFLPLETDLFSPARLSSFFLRQTKLLRSRSVS